MHRARIALDDIGVARSIAGILEELIEQPPLAVSLFEVPGGGWEVVAYYESEPERAAIAATIEVVSAGSSGALTFEAVPDENWVAVSQAGLPPVAAGRFLIHGSHDRAIGRLRRNAIEIDAGEAFGTAHHATTLGCLLAIDRLTRQHRFIRVLDLGCGSGVLAIAAARVLPSASIAASDFDPEAVRGLRSRAPKELFVSIRYFEWTNFIRALACQHNFVPGVTDISAEEELCNRTDVDGRLFQVKNCLDGLLQVCEAQDITEIFSEQVRACL